MPRFTVYHATVESGKPTTGGYVNVTSSTPSRAARTVTRKLFGAGATARPSKEIERMFIVNGHEDTRLLVKYHGES